MKIRESIKKEDIRFAIGIEIYYEGDMANLPDAGTITKLREATKYGSKSIDILLNDGRKMKGIWLTAFDDSIGKRFWIKSDYDTMREAKIIASMMSAPVRYLTCACCGSETRGRQWWNRDTGYGLCLNCIKLVSSKISAEEMKSCYGYDGVNYNIKK